MGIKKNLWPIEQNGKIVLPRNPYCLSCSEKESLCQIMNNLKVPKGYSSNWKLKVSMSDLKIKGLISHDYHILMQQLLLVFLMNAYKKETNLLAAIQELSSFFNVLCSKVICRQELENMREKIVKVVCVFEKYFPPSFFVIMIHLLVHLADEALLCGPVRYRWMYPFERWVKYHLWFVFILLWI